jgi:hypothetical protein
MSEITICDDLLFIKKLLYITAIRVPNIPVLKTLDVRAGLASLYMF